MNPVSYWYCLVLKSEIISGIGSIEEMNLPPDQMPVLDFRKLNNTRYNFYGKVNQQDLEQILRVLICMFD